MKHPTNIQKYDGTLRELARDIVNLRYDSLNKFYKYLSEEFFKDAEHDKNLGHKKVFDLLSSISEDNSNLEKKLFSLWKICKKYME